MAVAEFRARPRAGLVLVLLALSALTTLPGCGADENAMARGDRLWADSDYTAALAEYRLALRRRPDDTVLLARVAHARAATSDLASARESYGRLLARDSGALDQAVYDYLAIARRAEMRGDRYGTAAAVQAAAQLRPGLVPRDLAATLARYYANAGDPDRALAYFERAVATEPPDSAGAMLFEMAQIQESQGNCADAITYYDAYRERAPRGPRAEDARWHVGSCEFELGQRAQRENRLVDALADYQAVIDLGVPENLLDQAWFQRGEILLAQGMREDALAAYQRVLQLNPARTGQLVQRASQRIDQIRFGG
jgi:tetratricopeptide (TPR) repeat protein